VRSDLAVLGLDLISLEQLRPSSETSSNKPDLTEAHGTIRDVTTTTTNEHRSADSSSSSPSSSSASWPRSSLFKSSHEKESSGGYESDSESAVSTPRTPTRKPYGTDDEDNSTPVDLEPGFTSDHPHLNSAATTSVSDTDDLEDAEDCAADGEQSPSVGPH